jgi:hypothetical protein
VTNAQCVASRVRPAARATALSMGVEGQGRRRHLLAMWDASDPGEAWYPGPPSAPPEAPAGDGPIDHRQDQSVPDHGSIGPEDVAGAEGVPIKPVRWLGHPRWPPGHGAGERTQGFSQVPRSSVPLRLTTPGSSWSLAAKLACA